MSLSMWLIATCDAAPEILDQILPNPAIAMAGVVFRRSAMIPQNVKSGFHVGDPWEAALLSTPGVDFLLCAGYPSKIGNPVLAHCRLGGFNVHPSLLPEYPGRLPGPQIVKDQFPWAGITIHSMTQVIDSGPIVLQVRAAMRRPYTGEELERVEKHLTVSSVTTFVHLLLAGQIM